MTYNKTINLGKKQYRVEFTFRRGYWQWTYHPRPKGPGSAKTVGVLERKCAETAAGLRIPWIVKNNGQ